MSRAVLVAALLLALPCWSAEPLRLRNGALDVRLDPATGAIEVTDRRVRRQWNQQPFGDAIAVSAVRQTAAGLEVEALDRVNNLRLVATITLSMQQPEIEVLLSASGPVAKPVAFSHPFATGKGTHLVVPMNEGILYPVDDPAIAPHQFIAYGGHGICMPWFGVADDASGAGIMAIIGTPDDARIDITRREGTGLLIRPLWDASRRAFSYPRQLTYVLLDKGGYVAQSTPTCGRRKLPPAFAERAGPTISPPTLTAATKWRCSSTSRRS
ncbi:MAG: hypothetical protein AAB225_04925 [Acidobacteriota bacterium]